MIKHLYLDIRVLKHIEALKRSGKKAALAAARAEKLIAGLEAHGRVPDSAATLTRHGELRIKGARKYDLGSGYRLITFKQGQRLFLLFAGSHDNCDRWLENNRELPLVQIEQRCRHRVVATPSREGKKIPRHQAPTPQKDIDDPLAAVSENDLRRIFRGLSGDSP
jgi:hypothetical protein